MSNYDFTLTGGPWLLFDHYLTVRPWDPGFDPNNTEIEKTTFWVRILGIPMEFLDTKILTFWEIKLEKL